jgi:hypothetical protein
MRAQPGRALVSLLVACFLAALAVLVIGGLLWLLLKLTLAVVAILLPLLLLVGVVVLVLWLLGWRPPA